MRVQKWWSLFGRYWLTLNPHNDDDTKLNGWLMNGACHGTIDTCGENSGSFEPLYDRVRGIRLLIGGGIDNRSKLLKMELGQQAPIKSKQKMKRDIMRHACSSCFQQVRLPLHNSCWSSFKACFDYSMPNSRNVFFYACVTQKFYDRDPSIGTLMVYCNENNQIIDYIMEMQIVINVIVWIYLEN